MTFLINKMARPTMRQRLITDVSPYPSGYHRLHRDTFPLWLASVWVWLAFTAQAGVAQTIAYTDATIETLSDQGRIENGTILVRGDKIEAVGTDVTVPDEARVVSLAGKTIIPGLIDPYIVFKRSDRTGDDSEAVTFGGRTFQVPRDRDFTTGNFDRIRELFYPQTFDFSTIIRCGITTVNLVSDGRGLSAYADTTFEPTPQMLFEPRGLLFLRITNQTAALNQIRTPLGARSNSNNQPTAAANSANRTAASDITNTEPTPAETTQDYWNEVKEGKKTLLVNANNAAAVAHLILILEKNPKVKVALIVSGPNVYQSLDKLQGKNVTLILKPEIATEPFSSRQINVAKMAADRDIPVAFSLFLGTSQLQNTLDEPLYPLAELIKTGLPRDKALAGLSLEPAKIMGIDSEYGTIAPGKYANWVVYDNDPLSNGSRLEQVIVKGTRIYEN